MVFTVVGLAALFLFIHDLQTCRLASIAEVHSKDVDFLSTYFVSPTCSRILLQSRLRSSHCTMSFSQTANALGHETWSICDASQVDHMIEKGIKLSKLKKEIKNAMNKGSSSFFTAFGGLNVNCDFEVLNAENQPIKGLCAASFEASRKISHAYAT